MNTHNNIRTKAAYSAPEVSSVRLDNEISLVLASDALPMGDPTFSIINEPFENELFLPPTEVMGL